MKTKAILLILSLCIGIWSCNKNKENPLQEEDCCKLNNEKLRKKHYLMEGVIKYSDLYKEYVAVYKGDNPKWSFSEHLFCPRLDPKYCKKGLKVKVIGEHYEGYEYRGDCLCPVYRFRDYKIIETEDCFISEDEKLLKKHFWLEGVVKYSDFYKEYVVVYKGDNPEWFSTEHLFCPNLEPKFCKEGLKVKVRGEHYLGHEPYKFDPDYPGGCFFDVYRFRNYRITEIK